MRVQHFHHGLLSRSGHQQYKAAFANEQSPARFTASMPKGWWKGKQRKQIPVPIQNTPLVFELPFDQAIILGRHGTIRTTHSAMVSRAHLRLEKIRGKGGVPYLVISDLNSRHGTMVDNHFLFPKWEYELKPGRRFSLPPHPGLIFTVKANLDIELTQAQEILVPYEWIREVKKPPETRWEKWCAAWSEQRINRQTRTFASRHRMSQKIRDGFKYADPGVRFDHRGNVIGKPIWDIAIVDRKRDPVLRQFLQGAKQIIGTSGNLAHVIQHYLSTWMPPNPGQWQDDIPDQEFAAQAGKQRFLGELIAEKNINQHYRPLLIKLLMDEFGLKHQLTH